MSSLCLLRWCALSLSLFAVAGHATDPYPQRAVRIVAPAPSGSAPDIVARLLAEKLAAAFGQPVVVENRPGMIALSLEQVARSAPDGHTLLFTSDAAITIAPHLQAPGQPFQVLRELTPVAPAVTDTFLLAVNPALPVNTLDELVALAKASRPSLAYASAGVGSYAHLLVERLRSASGMDLLHVPYKGIVQAVTATVAGDTALTAGSVPVLNQVKAGRLRALAVSGTRRLHGMPGLPALAETYPSLDTAIWLGIFAPAATPAAVLARLREEMAIAMAADDTRRRLEASGGGLLQPWNVSPEQFMEVIRRDSLRHGETIKRLGLKLE